MSVASELRELRADAKEAPEVDITESQKKSHAYRAGYREGYLDAMELSVEIAELEEEE